MHNIQMISRNIFNMILFDKFKTGDPVIDTIIFTVALTFFTTIIHYLNENINVNNIIYSIYNMELNDLFCKKHTIEYEGFLLTTTGLYHDNLNQLGKFSESYRALWAHIMQNVEKNNTIHSIKEYSCNIRSNSNAEKHTNFGAYMVVQEKSFLISEPMGIYAVTRISNVYEAETDSKHGNNRTKQMEKIAITLFSYKSNITAIKKYVEELTANYLKNIELLRENKSFIYTLAKICYETNKCEMWNETEFSSTRQFNNLFFKNKQMVINKLDFFLNNMKWYYDKGIPYSFGFGLYGPPGTGKTSLIKAMANYTNRHIVVIPLKLIKTKTQLDDAFYENRYNLENQRNSIGFNKKIIVFEDLDCIGDIVLNRETKKQKNVTVDEDKEKSTINITNINELLGSIVTDKITDKDKETDRHFTFTNTEPPITLDDILNLWDGIRETPGRIMVITSNHYQDLDPALIRPGRIDLTLELSFINHELIKEMYCHLFGEPMNDEDETILWDVQENFYSPAEIINIYMNEKDHLKFMERLAENKHV